MLEIQENWDPGQDQKEKERSTGCFTFSPASAGPSGAREVWAALEQFVRLYHLEIAIFKWSKRAGDFLEQSAFDLKSSGTDRLGT